jgi:hypothetical protein
MYTINVNQMYDPYFYPSSHTYKYKHVLCGRKIVVISCNRDNPQLMYLQYIIICTATKMPTDVTTHTNLSRAFSLLIPSVENRHNFKSTTTTVQCINRKARTKTIKLIQNTSSTFSEKRSKLKTKKCDKPSKIFSIPVTHFQPFTFF